RNGGSERALLGRGPRQVPGHQWKDPRSKECRLAAVPPDESLGDAAERTRLFRERFWPWPSHRLRLRRQLPHRRSACRLWRKRLLRPRQQVTAILLLRQG